MGGAPSASRNPQYQGHTVRHPGPDSAKTLLERSFGRTLGTHQTESRAAVKGLAVGATTKGDLFERAIRAVYGGLLAVIAPGIPDPTNRN